MIIVQGRPLPFINGVIIPISRVISYNPRQTHVFPAIYRGPITPFITGFWAQHIVTMVTLPLSKWDDPPSNASGNNSLLRDHDGFFDPSLLRAISWGGVALSRESYPPQSYPPQEIRPYDQGLLTIGFPQ